MKKARTRVALVVMPWWPSRYMPVGVAALKAHLEANGIEADCHYLNLRMWQRVGGLAKDLPEDLLFQEWLFGHHLFGPKGTGELPHGLADVLRVKGEHVPSLSRPQRDRLEQLLEVHVPAFLADALEAIPWSRYDLVGFSSLAGTHTACLKLSKMIKDRFPKTRIALGGTGVEGAMGPAWLKGCEWIDYAFDGEAEEALLALARAIANGEPHADIPGVSQRRDDGIAPNPPGKKRLVDVARMPDPDHDDYFRQLRQTGHPTTDQHVTFEASRGCWWGEKQHCTFCGLNGLDMSFRAKPAEAVAGSMLRLHRRYKCRHLHACDDILAASHLRELLPRLAEMRRREGGLDWTIFFETRANLTEEQVTAMAEAGVTHIQPGIESLSSPLLRRMRKGTRAIQNVQLLKMAQSRGIRSSWNFLYGLPGETDADYKPVLELIPRIAHIQPPQSHGALRLDRFSPYHFDWKKLGTGKPIPDPFYGLVYPPGRFVLDDIAYHFSFRDPAPPRPGLEKALKFWREVWHESFFAYIPGVDFVEVHDARPASIGARPRYRRSTLRGLEATLFRACETTQPRERLASVARSSGATERAAFAVLGELVDRRLLIEEDGAYLNPAIPAARLPASHKMALSRACPAALC